MKSQMRTMLRTWKAASHDAALACALPLSRVARDYLTLERIASSRGLGVFLLDLPTLDDILLQTLETGCAHFSGPLTARKSKSDSRPKFLWDFWSLVVDETGMLLSNPSPDAMMAIRQLTKGLSKLEVQCTEARLEKSIQEFHDIESSIIMPNESWDSDDLVLSDCALDRMVPVLNLLERYSTAFVGREHEFTRFARRFDKVAGILISELGAFDPLSEDSPENGFFKHGPGAVSNQPGRRYKYLFPGWSDKLDRVFPFDWCSGSPLGTPPPSQGEMPGRLLAVPKTAKGPRLIASEPIEHQWCQQKIASWLAYRFDRTRVGRFISLKDQALSQRLVASASQDRSLATIDLSSASDRVATWHIETLFRVNPELIRAMHAVRTRRIEDGVLGKGISSLKKFTTMGSALTFPVQSIFFLAVALAACGAATPREIDRLVGKVRVFGDDIIVPTTSYAMVTECLTALGLKVNLKKSFFRGAFRESCGADYWDGWNITPVKPKTVTPGTALSIQALLDSSNNFHMRGYWRTAEALACLLPRSIKNGTVTRVDELHPYLVNGKKRKSLVGRVVVALHTFGEEFFPALRWNEDLHRWDVRTIGLHNPIEQEKQHHSAALREFFTRPWREFFPRETGVARNRVAKLAARWVGHFPMARSPVA